MIKRSFFGFSLVELLAVIAILALISVFALPAVNTMLRGSQLTRAGDNTAALLSLARQTALAKNHSVEVRFYQFGDSETPGETSSTPSSGKYRAMQIFEVAEDGKVSALGKTQRLPNAIIMDSGSNFSTLLATAQDKTWSDPSNDPKVGIPRVGTNYNCKAFRFTSDGSANLSKTSLWFITLHNAVEGNIGDSPPANYITVQLDPASGGLKVWRP